MSMVTLQVRKLKAGKEGNTASPSDWKPSAPPKGLLSGVKYQVFYFVLFLEISLEIAWERVKTPNPAKERGVPGMGKVERGRRAVSVTVTQKEKSLAGFRPGGGNRLQLAS